MNKPFNNLTRKKPWKRESKDELPCVDNLKNKKLLTNAHLTIIREPSELIIFECSAEWMGRDKEKNILRRTRHNRENGIEWKRTQQILKKWIYLRWGIIFPNSLWPRRNLSSFIISDNFCSWLATRQGEKFILDYCRARIMHRTISLWDLINDAWFSVHITYC